MAVGHEAIMDTLFESGEFEDWTIHEYFEQSKSVGYSFIDNFTPEEIEAGVNFGDEILSLDLTMFEKIVLPFIEDNPQPDLPNAAAESRVVNEIIRAFIMDSLPQWHVYLTKLLANAEKKES